MKWCQAAAARAGRVGGERRRACTRRQCPPPTAVHFACVYCMLASVDVHKSQAGTRREPLLLLLLCSPARTEQQVVVARAVEEQGDV